MRRDVFQAIADPTRREIIGMLAEKTANVNELSDNFSMSRTAVSKHLRILQECGVVEVVKQGRERHCRARLDALAEVAVWINQYRLFWNDSLDRLEALLNQEDQTPKKLKS
ncbi:MAG: metalloregulator ArsR/SmtB family transcription factor [Cytophagales bacterium]|nr:metalloregulator ArsR/SmtB family transcription factor [Cytophagales bacterium]